MQDPCSSFLVSLLHWSFIATSLRSITSLPNFWFSHRSCAFMADTSRAFPLLVTPAQVPPYSIHDTWSSDSLRKPDLQGETVVSGGFWPGTGEEVHPPSPEGYLSESLGTRVWHLSVPTGTARSYRSGWSVTPSRLLTERNAEMRSEMPGVCLKHQPPAEWRERECVADRYCSLRQHTRVRRKVRFCFTLRVAEDSSCLLLASADRGWMAACKGQS